MTESLIRKALSCIDREQWKPVRNGDKIRVKSSRFQMEVTGGIYDSEALASYLAAVSPENIAALLVEMDELRNRIKSNGYDDDIWHNIVKLQLKSNEGKGS